MRKIKVHGIWKHKEMLYLKLDKKFDQEKLFSYMEIFPPCEFKTIAEETDFATRAERNSIKMTCVAGKRNIHLFIETTPKKTRKIFEKIKHGIELPKFKVKK